MSKGSSQKLKLSFLTKIMLEKTDDEHSELMVDVNVSPQFFGWIFGLGKDVKVETCNVVIVNDEKVGK